jgi:hypothetical protein
LLIAIFGALSVSCGTGGNDNPDASMGADSSDIQEDGGGSEDGSNGEDTDPSEDPPERNTQIEPPATGGEWTSTGGPQSGFERLMKSPGPTAYFSTESERLVFTEDCGQTHVTVPLSETGLSSTPREGASNSDGMALHATGTTVFSTDGGESWSSSSSTLDNVQALEGATSGLYAVSIDEQNNASVLKSTKGDTWSTLKSDFGFRLPIVSFEALGQNLFLRKDNDTMYISTDGGSTWSSESDFDAPRFPWVQAASNFYATESGTLLQSTDGLAWSAVSNDGLPDEILEISSTGNELVVLDDTGTAYRVLDLNSQLDVEEFATFGVSPGIDTSLSACSRTNVALAGESGLARLPDGFGSASSWGPMPATSPKRVFAQDGFIASLSGSGLRIRRNGKGLFAHAAADLFNSFNGPGIVESFDSANGSLYIGGRNKDGGVDRGEFYTEVSPGNWNRAIRDVQKTTCASPPCESRNPLSQAPTSLVQTQEGAVAGFRGRVEGADGMSVIDILGGGLVRNVQGQSQSYTDGLPSRRCQGDETLEKDLATLCPPSIKDLTFLNDLWIATGDPHTDTFEVFRRGLDDSQWQSAHAGLPSEIQDNIPLNEDTGDSYTEADFAIADTTLFLRVRQMPADTTEIFWFDEGTEKWWPMPTDGLEGESVIEIIGGRGLAAGTSQGIYFWSDSEGSWQSMGSGFPSADANDYHISTSGRVNVATDGRGVWSLE